MPISNYGVFKGHLRSWELPKDGPHALLSLDVGKGLKISAALNIVPSSDKSSLVYWLERDYQNPELWPRLSALKLGTHQKIHQSLALDLVRKQPLVFNKGTVIRDTVVLESNKLVHGFINHLSDTRRSGTVFYVFGSLSADNLCLNNIHLNQGSAGSFQGENAAFQDGGIVMEFPDGHWEALFIAFACQAPVTNNNGQPNGPVLRDFIFDAQELSGDAKSTNNELDVGTKNIPRAARDFPTETELAMLNDEVEGREGIRIRTQTCLDLFESCQQYPILSDDDWIDKMSANFNWWSLGIGAAKRGHSSLDYRVQARDDVRSVLVSLLDSLVVSLRNCINIVQEAEKEPGKPAPLISDEDSELGEQAYYIKTTLDFLARISAGIRKSGTKFRHQRADKLLKQNAAKLGDFRDYLQHLILIGPAKMHLFNTILYRHTITADPVWRTTALTLAAYFKDARRLTPVQSRLIQANLVRRNRFDLYFRLYRRKVGTRAATAPLAPDTADIATQTQGNQHSQTKAQTQGADSASRTHKAIQMPAVVEGSVMSSQPATGIGSFVLPQRVPAQQAKSVGTRVSLGALKQDYPKCPVAEGDNFWCPYCAQPLDASYADPKRTRRWRGHVAEDLSPYVCVYPECDKPDALYVTTEDWKKHLKDSHSAPSWICDPCWLESNTPGDFEFDRKEDWYDHTITEHVGEFEDDELPELLEASQRMVVPPVACPLCYENTAPLQPETDKHIAEHLHSFALQALPWETVGADDDTKASIGSVDRGPVAAEEGDTAEEDIDWEEPYDPSEFLEHSKTLMESFYHTSYAARQHRTDFHRILSAIEVRLLAGDGHATDGPARNDIVLHIVQLNSALEAVIGYDSDLGDADSAASMFEDVEKSLTALKSLLMPVDAQEALLEENNEKTNQAYSEQPPVVDDDPDTNDQESESSRCDRKFSELKQRILESRVWSAFDEKLFCPDGSLDRVISYERLFDAFSDLLSMVDDHRKLLVWIVEKAKKLFATVTCIDSSRHSVLSAMEIFRRGLHDDGDFPFADDVTHSGTYLTEQFRYGLSWTRDEYGNFLAKQWEFLVPVFSRGRPHNHVLPDAAILPIEWLAERRHGAYGSVQRMGLHPDHIVYRGNFPPQDENPSSRALKEVTGDLVQMTAEKMERALDMNGTHSNYRNRYIFSIMRGSQCWFVSNWAHGGNLEDLWQSTSRPAFEAGEVRNMIWQFRGLADILYSLHREDITHGGIKPTNILRTDTATTTLGLLLFSDVGLADLRGSYLQRGPSRYDPPEGGALAISPVPQSYDIWCIGCIIFETLVWILYGTSELNRFHDELGQQSGFFETKPRDYIEDSEMKEIMADQFNRRDRSFLCPVEGCSLAPLGFTTNKDLERHFNISHPDAERLASRTLDLDRPETERFTHQYRSTNSTQAANLEAQKNSHLGQRPFACAICGRRFTRLNDLRRHEKVHKRRSFAGTHPTVKTWINHMKKDPECIQQTATRDLLELVSDRLLVLYTKSQYSMDVPLDEMSGEDRYYRATASELCGCLDRILDNARKIGDSYLAMSSSRTHLQGPGRSLDPLEEATSYTEHLESLVQAKAMGNNVKDELDLSNELSTDIPTELTKTIPIEVQQKWIGDLRTELAQVYLEVSKEQMPALSDQDTNHLFNIVQQKITDANQPFHSDSVADNLLLEYKSLIATIWKEELLRLRNTNANDLNLHRAAILDILGMVVNRIDKVTGILPDSDNRPASDDLINALQKFFPNVDVDQPVLGDLSLDALRHKALIISNIQVNTANTSNLLHGDTSQDVSSKPVIELSWFKGYLIGKGSYGRVYLGLNAMTGEFLAVKEIPIDGQGGESDKARGNTPLATIDRQIDILQDLGRHPNIVEFVGSEKLPDFVNIFLEYVPGGSIGACLRRYGAFEEKLVARFTRQLTSGLAYLHQKGIIHRNLTADGILLEPSGTAKISDFDYSIKTNTDGRSSGSADEFVGSVFSMAPEIIRSQGGPVTTAIDIWALGCAVLQMFTGRRPWAKEEAVGAIYKLGNGEVPPIPAEVRENINAYGYAFMIDCLTFDPSERPTAEALLSRHPFIEEDLEFDFTKTKLHENLNTPSGVTKDEDEQESRSIAAPETSSQS